MPTKNPRINITFDKPTAGMLNKLAKEEDKSMSSVAKELIWESLERREDKLLSSLAEERDKQAFKRRTHEDVWQDL